ncbi:MAG: tryptophan 2,3-dioxygenase family protein [Thermoanaerobaculia bacterium]|jgi:tryptophan 2,3-dioxygenase
MTQKGPLLEGTGKTDYERYIRTDELLALQKDEGKLVHPEERLFQITHQAAELWLKQLDCEVNRIAAMMGEGKLTMASDLLHRCRMILDLLRDQIVIVETMAPADYHVIRLNALGKGSGQESPGFNKLLDVRHRLWPPFEQILRGAGATPLAVLRSPREHDELHRLAQAMLDYDAAFMKWRYTHLRLALRIIGSRVKSLKGVPVMQLESGTREPLFSELWDAISDLTDETRPEY